MSFIFTYHRQSLQDLSVQHVEGCQNQSLMRKSSPSSQAACQGLLVVLLCLTSFRKCGCVFVGGSVLNHSVGLQTCRDRPEPATQQRCVQYVLTFQQHKAGSITRNRGINLPTGYNCLFFLVTLHLKKKHTYRERERENPNRILDEYHFRPWTSYYTSNLSGLCTSSSGAVTSHRHSNVPPRAISSQFSLPHYHQKY